VTEGFDLSPKQTVGNAVHVLFQKAGASLTFPIGSNPWRILRTKSQGSGFGPDQKLEALLKAMR